MVAPGASVGGAINSTRVMTGAALGVVGVGVARPHETVSARVRSESAKKRAAEFIMMAGTSRRFESCAESVVDLIWWASTPGLDPDSESSRTHTNGNTNGCSDR